MGRGGRIRQAAGIKHPRSASAGGRAPPAVSGTRRALAMASRPRTSSKKVIYAALLGNLVIAISKFGAAAFTGSAAMLSEAVHSLVDTGNEVLLLYGIRRAVRPPDEAHPLGHGRELYFWSFIVALLIFALGAGVSVIDGVDQLRHPSPISNPTVNYAVLGISFLFEGASWCISLTEFRARKGSLGYLEAVRRSKDPTSFMVLFEDSAAIIGILIALIGTYASEALQQPVFDGAASLAIGLVLAVTSMFLARESKSLLIGEAARPALVRSICRLAAEQPGIERVNGVITVQMAPDQVFVALSVDFADDLKAADIEAAVAALEQRIKRENPEVAAVFVKPQTASAFQRARDRRFSDRAI
ncbi:MAG TPA: cation diffusion facilitator family transporter [Stellaceae bacterium]